MARFDAHPAAEVIESAYWFETNDTPLLHHDLTLSDLAHLLHLVEQNLIPRDVARKLICGVLDLDQDTQFKYDPVFGDAFMNRERWLAAFAQDAIGYYSTGRARREATTVAFRLLIRRQLIELVRALGDAASALLDLAARHVETLMPDYTYLQQAQPTTFAHYLLSFIFPLFRSFASFRASFGLVNQSPAGIGATNGSRLPLLRERLAELLGFDGVITHTRDAMWQVDVPIQVISATALVMLQLDRLAEDLQIFNSIEFGFIELSDDFARASVIMPQKKNPYPFAFVRGAAGSMIGDVTKLFVTARTPSAQVDNRIFAHGAVPRALDLATRCVRLMAGACSTMVVHKPAMQHAIGAGFTQATDLADMLTEKFGLDYRKAHEVVGQVVQELMASQKTLNDVTPEQVSSTAREIAGQPLNVTAQQLSGALDAKAGIAARAGIGGAAAERVREMIGECRDDLAKQRAWADETARRIEAAEQGLVENAKNLGQL